MTASQTLWFILATWIAAGSSAAGAEWMQVDQFQSTTSGSIPAVDMGWMVDKGTGAKVEAVPGTSDDLAVRIHHLNADNGNHDVMFNRGFLHLRPGATGTVFMRFMVPEGTGSIATSLAYTESHLNAGTRLGGVQIGGNASELGITGIAGGESALKLTRGRWYRLWMVIENRVDAAGVGTAVLSEDTPGAPQQVVPGSLSKGRAAAQLDFSCVGVIKANTNKDTDFWIDDLFIDNLGRNLSDPLVVVRPVAATRQELALSTDLQPAGTPSDTVHEDIDALGPNEVYQSMAPSDVTMPIPRFPAFRVLPLSPTATGVTLAKSYPLDPGLARYLPTWNVSTVQGGVSTPFHRGGTGCRFDYRVGNLLRLVDGSVAGEERTTEVLLLTHRLALVRLRAAGGPQLALSASWSAIGTAVTEPIAHHPTAQVITNGLGWHALDVVAGEPGTRTAVLVYEAADRAEAERLLDSGVAAAADFDATWAKLAKYHDLTPFLTGAEAPLRRNLVAACLNRVLRNQRQGGVIQQPSAIEFFGPEWYTADKVWMWFLPACRYHLWIEPSFYANSLRAILDQQSEEGYTPQMVGQLGGGSTQNPDVSPIAYEYYRFTGDRTILPYAVPRLVKMYQWFLKNRNQDGSGLFAIGHANNPLKLNIGEYGRDNGPVEHGIIPSMRGIAEVDGRQERLFLPDIIACQARLAEDIATMAHEMGDAETERIYTDEYKRVKDWVNANLWDEETKFYYPVIRASKTMVKRRLNTAFWLLWAGIPDQQRKDALVQALMDPKQFFTTIPVPQLALNDPFFDPKIIHWGDGHCWPIDTSIIFDGLLRYQEWDTAARFARQWNDGVFNAIAKTYRPSEWYIHDGRPAGCSIMGTAGCLPLVFQRYLKEYAAGTVKTEWSKLIPPAN